MSDEKKSNWTLQEDIQLVDQGYKQGHEEGYQTGKADGIAQERIKTLEAENKALKQEVRAEKAERKVAELKLELATQNA